MNKLIYLILGAVILSGCSGKKTVGEVDSDTVAAENPMDHTEAVVPIAYITEEGVGEVKIGMSVNDVPQSVDGLYTQRVHGASPDAVTLEFMIEDSPRFVAYDFGEGKIDVINLIGSNVKVSTVKGDLGIGDPMEEVLDLPGVSAEWSGYDGGGMWYWKWEGLWFAPSQDNLSQALSQRLYHSGQPPTIKDFQDGKVTIGFIGTGLPF